MAYTGLLPAFQLAPNGTGATVPRGGFMWDGRSADLKAQVLSPMLGALEMANGTSATVLVKLLTRPYLATFRTVFGDATTNTNTNTVLANIADAIAQYEKEDPSIAAFNSKYDAVQAGLGGTAPMGPALQRRLRYHPAGGLPTASAMRCCDTEMSGKSAL